eukprot:986943-Prymnesium_polylepis.1
MPSTLGWGTRAPGAHGCGKCAPPARDALTLPPYHPNHRTIPTTVPPQPPYHTVPPYHRTTPTTVPQRTTVPPPTTALPLPPLHHHPTTLHTQPPSTPRPAPPYTTAPCCTALQGGATRRCPPPRCRAQPLCSSRSQVPLVPQGLPRLHRRRANLPVAQDHAARAGHDWPAAARAGRGGRALRRRVGPRARDPAAARARGHRQRARAERSRRLRRAGGAGRAWAQGGRVCARRVGGVRAAASGVRTGALRRLCARRRHRIPVARELTTHHARSHNPHAPRSQHASRGPPRADDYVAFGRMGFFRLREAGLGHCSLTFFVNEARGANGAATGRGNVRYATVRSRDEGLLFGLLALEDVAAGAELLANYDHREATQARV